MLFIGLLLLASVAVAIHDPMARTLAAALRSIERASATIHIVATHKEALHVRR